MGNCLLCSSNAVINRQESAIRTIYNCQNCGVFVVSDMVQDDIKAFVPETLAYLMHHKLTRHTDIVLITFEKANLDRDYLQLTVEQIANAFPVDFTEQMDMVLKNLELLSGFPGDEVRVEGLNMAPLFYLRKNNLEALSFVIKSMQKARLIDVNYYGSGAFFPCGVIISPGGWDRLAELKSGISRRKTVFVCAPRGRADTVEDIYRAGKRLCANMGFYYSDNISVKSDAKIGNELVDAVRSSTLVICDLSEMSGESYYAAALAKGFSKPCIITCHTSAVHKPQINTSHTNVIFWDKFDTLDIELESEFKNLLHD